MFDFLNKNEKSKMIWKKKATQKREENKKLKKRIEELTKSRDIWKEKAVKLKKETETLNYNLKKKLIN